MLKWLIRLLIGSGYFFLLVPAAMAASKKNVAVNQVIYQCPVMQGKYSLETTPVLKDGWVLWLSTQKEVTINTAKDRNYVTHRLARDDLYGYQQADSACQHGRITLACEGATRTGISYIVNKVVTDATSCHENTKQNGFICYCNKQAGTGTSESYQTSPVPIGSAQ